MSQHIRTEDGTILLVGFSDEERKTEIAIAYLDEIEEMQIISINLSVTQLQILSNIISYQIDLMKNLEKIIKN